MGRNNEDIKKLIIGIIGHNKQIRLSDLLSAVNQELENGKIDMRALNEFITDMPEHIKRIPHLPQDEECVELASSKPATLPTSTTQNNINKLPSKVVRLPNGAKKK